jgi:topoisomerase IA-like protein
MEDTLDKIAEGDATYVGVCKTFWKDLAGKLQDYLKNNNIKEKVNLVKESRPIMVNTENGKSECLVRNTRYGPVVEHVVSGKKSFIDLRSFFRVFGKDVDTIETKEIEFLVSIPCPMVSNKDCKLNYGRYGFYIKNELGETASIYPSVLKKLASANGNKWTNALLEIDCNELYSTAKTKKSTSGKNTSRKVTPTSSKSGKNTSRRSIKK